jgi:N-methylhydantoinase B/oxoprolinase/acetone carboxylase alpha subunit
MVLTDIEAQVAANVVATRRLEAFMDEYELASLEELGETIQRRTEAAMRREIDAIPDGRYEAEEWIEGTGAPLVLKAAIDVGESDIYVDYAGSSPQSLGGGISCVFNYTRAHTVYPLKCVLSPRVPNNEGSFKPIHVSAPERSILNALPPASVNSRTKTGWHLHTLIFRALADALPERVQAGNGLMYTLRAYARDERGHPQNAHFICGGGRGAGYGVDGATRNCFPSSAGNVPVEIFESRVPLLVEEDTLVANYGSGQWRGAPGQRVTVRKLPGYERPVSIYVHPDRLRFPAPGLFGGAPSAINRLLKNGHDLAVNGALASGEIVLDDADDTFTSVVAGGGGYGPAVERDPSTREADIEAGLASDRGCCT